MIKINLNESTYGEVEKKIEDRQDINTTFRTYTTLTTYHGKKYPVYNIYVEYRNVAQDLYRYDYQWVLAGYTDNGVLYLTADEIHDYNLNPYMNGEVITDLEGMIKDYPEAFYIENQIEESTKKSLRRTLSLTESKRAKDATDDVLYKFYNYICGKKWGNGDWGDYTIARADVYGEFTEYDYVVFYVKAYEKTPDGRIKRINLTPAQFSFEITDENCNDYDEDLYNEIDKWLASQPA